MPRTEAADPLPTEFNPARYTHAVSREHRRGSVRVRDVLLDAYATVLGVGTIGALAGGLVLAMRNEVARALGSGTGGRRTVITADLTALPDGVAVTVLLFAALASVMAGARKLGPVAVSSAEGYWWLSLPVDRRQFLAGGLLRRVGLVWAAGAVLYLPVGFITDLQATFEGQLAGAVVFGLAAVCALLMAALRQSAGNGFPDEALGVAGGLVLLALLSLLPRLAAAGELWPGPVALAAAVGLWLVVFARMGAVPGRELIRGGGVSGHAGAALYLMDTNELGRAFAGTPRRGKTSHARRWYARGARTPFGALLRADTTAFLRTPGIWGRPVLVLLLCATVLLSAGQQPALLQLGIILLSIFAAVPALGTLARQTAITPGLDALLPLSPALVRLSRTALPAAALALWSAVFCAALVLLGAGTPELIGLGALAGVGFGAAAVRGAYRPLPDWSAPPVETVFGPVPTAQTGSLAQGLDTILLAAVPLLLGLFLGYVPAVLLLAQAGFSVVCVLLVMYSRPK
ncbi:MULTISPECIES: DUF6297 family protein [unclassified Arthrobacter]|uniref:DUF6297 family protein n=1 Tax=unclassified Arthrobacter TaxID=235627 RepID=UPI0024DFDEBC|nr:MULTISPECIES: DUF6297 family protein [unclassified Arthrobacter]MCC9144476.1 DUF6297 family protein [Arthrobacter sp. zg-Y919]MDK1275702.1 DUF6297 family protein [Arthrobacter sp. zg.Y919]WIB02931.1 DUF6297 family protein [Arthrobacter sp. zg-Y919]